MIFKINQSQPLATYLFIIAITALSGCSKTTVHDDGSVTMVGLLHATIKPTGAPETFAGDVIETRSIGVTAYQSEIGSGLSIGATQLSIASIKNNALVKGDPRNIH